MTKEQDTLFVGALVTLLTILWLGFGFHQAPRFAGSFWGGVFGVLGALFMLVPLLYMIIKRIKPLKKWVTKYVPMRRMLTWHIYAGVIGPILVLIHTGHKFESPLGIALTAMTLIVVFSGFVGRYLMSSISREIKEKKAMLGQLKDAYQGVESELANTPGQGEKLRFFSGFATRLFARFAIPTHALANHTALPVEVRAVRLAESIADVEYAIRTHETFKKAFRKWLKTHIALSLILYGLLGLHVWAAIHFGLRWFETSVSPDYYNRAAEVVVNERAPEEFSQHFASIFAKYWRPAVQINGVTTTVFDYAEMAKDAKDPGGAFQKAVAALNETNPYAFSLSNREKAFWINVYNFAAMKLVVDHYPIDSIRDRKVNLLSNPWSVGAVQIGNKEYSLTEIEKSILLRKYDDPRIVFAVSCAAVSCPDRSAEIFQADRLEEQLDALVSALFTNRDKGLAIDRATDSIRISWIVKADKALFTDEEENGLMAFVLRYASLEDKTWIESHRDGLSIDYFEHDWTLNDVAQADQPRRENG